MFAEFILQQLHLLIELGLFHLIPGQNVAKSLLHNTSCVHVLFHIRLQFTKSSAFVLQLLRIVVRTITLLTSRLEFKVG